MKRLTKRDIQRNELNILIAEKEICNFSNLKFYLSGGTYLSEVVKKYNLGIVIEDYGNIKENVIQYIENFVPNEFITNCRRLLTDVETDSGLLRNQLKNFFREESVKCLEKMK